MDLEISPPDYAVLEAPEYAVLMATTCCFKCGSPTPTAAIWVPSYIEQNEDGERYPGDGAAVLHYIERLDAGSLMHLQQVAPWLRPASTRTAGMCYLAHHCETCEAVQGDHFVFGVDGPYFPQDDAAISALRAIPGVGPLRAVATAAGSAWMGRVAV